MKTVWLTLAALVLLVSAVACEVFETEGPLSLTLTTRVDATSQQFPMTLYDGGEVDVDASEEVGYRFVEADAENPEYLRFLWPSDQGFPRTLFLNLKLSSVVNLNEASFFVIELDREDGNVSAYSVTFVEQDGSTDKYYLGRSSLSRVDVSEEVTVLKVELIRVSREVLENLREVQLVLSGSGTVQLRKIRVE